MKAANVCIIGLVFVVSASAEPLFEGRVRLASGEPVADAQVRLFDLSDLREGAIARALTDGTGYFALPLAALTGRALPARFALGPNYPNPFNPSTIIPYQLAASSQVRLEVFNLLGQRITTLVDGERPAGFHTATWHATDAAGRAVAAGVYIYRMTVGEESQTGRMVLIDGQAGMPAAGSGGSAAAVEAAGETAPVYGLTVSGPGLIPLIDPAFRVEADRGSVNLVVETLDSTPRAKVSATGILGDVDNNGQVDFSDALLVALYSQDNSIVLPNPGAISLGDVNADGQVDRADAGLISAYSNDPSDPTLPAGLGKRVSSATASLSPDPSTVSFADDGIWHRFTVQASESVSVVVNPGATSPRLELTTRSGRDNYCPGGADDAVSRADGEAIYLAGCASGTATVELRRESDDTVLQTYTFTVTASPADLVVSASVSASSLTPGQSFTLSATVRNQGTASASATTLRYYRSSNRTISWQDTQVGSDAVSALAASATSAESISLTAPSDVGTYYYGACVERKSGESAGNNCSIGIRVIVEEATEEEEEDDTPVTIPDANLRAAIEAALGKASGATITVADMKTLTRLVVQNKEIRDLTGLESASNLTRLDLGWNRITDISVLGSLTNLTELRLLGNNITDISALGSLTNLKRLFLEWNRITDISALGSLTNLTELWLNVNRITDISALGSLTNLTDLVLGRINTSDISVLGGLTNLKRLWLGGNNLSDSNVSVLSGLTNLTSLSLSDTKITDVSVLRGLTNLTWLVLNNTKITDVSVLGGLTNLRTLWLSVANITDISVLGSLTNLTELELLRNKIMDISALGGLTNLKELNLGENRITDVSVLGGLTNLTTLWLERNKIMDISALGDLTNLTRLELQFNNITDVSALGRLTNLTDLDLRGNPLSDSSINDYIPALESSGATVLFDQFRKGDFDIELVFLDPFTEDQKNVLQYVARRWMSVITEDLPEYEFTQGWSGRCGDHSYTIPSGERIDDLRIYMTSFDGGGAAVGGGVADTVARDLLSTRLGMHGVRLEMGQFADYRDP